MIKSLSKPLCLELLDISEVTLKTSIDEHITATTEIHSDFKCTYGFLNFGEKKIRIPSEDALSVIQVYCSKNNITLIDLFSKLDKVSFQFFFILLAPSVLLIHITYSYRMVQCLLHMKNSEKVSR